MIHLSPEAEPDIYQTTDGLGRFLRMWLWIRTPGLSIWMMVLITENTSASYPLTQIANFVPSGKGDHPKNIVFLTADAFGVMPPISN